MSQNALLRVNMSVTANGADIDRETLCATVGAWFDALPTEFKNIETVNADGDRVLIKLNVVTDVN